MIEQDQQSALGRGAGIVIKPRDSSQLLPHSPYEAPTTIPPLTTLLCAAALAAGPHAPAPRPYQDDTLAIQGKWRIVQAMEDGVPLRDFKGEFVFNGGKVTIATSRDQAALYFWLGRARQIDLSCGVDTTQRGIYSLDGNTLMLSFAHPRQGRPADFSGEAKWSSVYVLRRVRDRK